MLHLSELGLDNFKVPGDEVFGGGNGPSLQEAVPGLAQLAALHHHNTEVVQPLHITRVRRQDLSVARLSSIKVMEVVDVYENESLG